MKHYDDVDLIEIHFLPKPADAHLAICLPCRERLAAVAGTLREDAERHAAAVERQPETFWTRQRLAIDRAVQKRQRVMPQRARAMQIAAVFVAVMLSLVVLMNRQRVSRPAATPLVNAVAEVPAQITDTAPLQTIDEADDPWQSEQLNAYRSVIAWEEWIDDGSTGGNS